MQKQRYLKASSPTSESKKTMAVIIIFTLHRCIFQPRIIEICPIFYSLQVTNLSQKYKISDLQVKKSSMQNNQQDEIENYVEMRNEEQANEYQRKITFMREQIYNQYHHDQQILEKCGQYFVRYLKQEKGIETQEPTLTPLTFQQLEKLVRTFKQSILPKIIEERARSKINQSVILQDQDQIVQEIQMKEWNAQKVYYSNGAWDYELNGYQECKKQKPYFNQKRRNYKNIQILFGKAYTKKTGGFFGIGSTLQFWIEMKSEIINGTIERTFQDFIFLRQALKYSIPFTYIPPLDINENMRKKIDVEESRTAILSQCKKFINTVCKNEELLQNFYTFRFFTQRQYDNYVTHKKSLKETVINHTRLLKNQQGCVQIQISERNQLIKKDYGRRSEQLQRIWKNVTESNEKIIEKLRQIQNQIKNQKKNLQQVIKSISTSNQLLYSQSYEQLTQVLLLYNDVYKIHEENIINIQSFFKNVNSKHSNQAQKNWRTFLNYKAQVFQYSNEYQIRRKVFLDKQQSRQKEGIRASVSSPEQKSIKSSIISDLGIENNVERQLLWIQRHSKWQAYINSKFIKSFEGLIESDRETLKKIVKDSAQKTLQIKERQELSYISRIQIFN